MLLSSSTLHDGPSVPHRDGARLCRASKGGCRGAAGSLQISGVDRRVQRHGGLEASNLESQQENEAKGEEKKREMERV